jgi:predicted lipoprotein with Yx(FWY)xxD motif
VLGVVATACGSDYSSGSTTPPAAAASVVETDAPAASAAAAAPGYGKGTDAPATNDASTSAAEVMTAETDLGTVLVDASGMSLYMFEPDNQGPSVCEGDCIAAWPALAGPATAAAGVDPALLGSITRSDDGSEQVTYNGWPLYHFAQDAAAGDVNGQGLNGKWFLVDPTGAPIGE